MPTLITRLSKLSKRERWITITTVSIGVIAIFYQWILEPFVFDWLQIHHRTQQAYAERARLQNLIQHRDQIEKRYHELQGAMSTGKTEQELKIALLTEVDKLANASGLHVISVKPTIIKKQKDFCRYGVELQVRCESHKLVEFLFAMQQPEHLLYSDQFSIIAGRDQPPLTFTIHLSKTARLEP